MKRQGMGSGERRKALAAMLGRLNGFIQHVMDEEMSDVHGYSLVGSLYIVVNETTGLWELMSFTQLPEGWRKEIMKVVREVNLKWFAFAADLYDATQGLEDETDGEGTDG